ncbi:MAG: sporulation protein YqfD [Clostridium sp.]|nr:sporulation protein YqfD [Clostridium sp.]MCM1444450.1 sporulation protein YqfD [Candidatus Amulumruptor caecigallinarius]
MKNGFWMYLKSKIIISVKGYNLERFIHRLKNNNIELLDIKLIKYNEARITIYSFDYEKVIKLKTVYEIKKIGYKGFVRFKELLIKNIFLIISIIICFIVLKFLTSMIFNIKIIHNDKEIREIISNELLSHGIKKYSFKKDYNQIQIIKEDIVDKYKDKIEWIEIEMSGVNCIVRVQERSIINNVLENNKYEVVAKKSAVIKGISASSGVIVKNINDYVSKGDVVISGEVKLNDELKDIISAKGKIYGEVWYSTTVEYPFVYKEVTETGKVKDVYSIRFLNKYINIFDFKKFKNSIKEEKILFSNNILPIHLVKLHERETNVIDEIITEDIAIDRAEQLSIKKIEDNLKEDEYIIKSSILKVSVKENGVVLDMFFSVYEDITDYREIVIEEQKGE